MKNRFNVLAEMFVLVLAVHKKQQTELFAYMNVFNLFRRTHPQYADTLNGLLATAKASPVLEDKTLAQFELLLEKWIQSSPESLSDSEVEAAFEVLKQGLLN